ncbi:fumarylacetoacetate hydrolase family protein [Camelimonas abortus]|uniref:Fumarylacetoacetate hydrolase family protein n=1 Tax=Camelimonas abortus TaxID=1017184 RepID=A0ABV7LH97_9HYPH
MKLLRYGPPCAEKPGLLDAGGVIRDLSGVVPDISGATLGAESLARLRAIDPATLPEVPAGVRLGPCVAGTRNFVAVGLNYTDHAAETGMAPPAEPILFSKAPSCIVGPDDDVLIPPGSQKTDWEVELAIVIGERCSYVSEADALDHVAGYCLCNDLSERAYQMERGGTWMKGKGSPTFGPIGPWLVTVDELGDASDLRLWLSVNGQRVQDGTTANMIFKVPAIVSYVSQFMALEPGDLITTGTPAGVGMGMKPPRYLKPGDVIELGADGLGQQRQQVRATA